jgi:beta-glucosidase
MYRKRGARGARRHRLATSASFTLTNTGKRPGAEVAQVYVADPPSVGEPPHQLKGYRKVFLGPGESTRVTVPFDGRSFAHWDDARHAWAVTGGTYTVYVGGSSRDLPLQQALHVRSS